jgi:hypothetical protein
VAPSPWSEQLSWSTKSLPLQLLDSLDSRFGARTAVIHELGHVLGLSPPHPIDDTIDTHENEVLTPLTIAPPSPTQTRSTSMVISRATLAIRIATATATPT